MANNLQPAVDSSTARSLFFDWREMNWVCVPLGLAVSALFFPKVNLFLFSMHGGVGWLLLMFCGPYYLVRLYLVAYRRTRQGQPCAVGLITCLACYLGVTFLIGELATPPISGGLGYKFRGRCIWHSMNLPWALLYEKKPCGPYVR